MKVVLQRVLNANVKVNEIIKGQINKGICILLGIGTDDTTDDADWLVHKIINLRIFEDEHDYMNKSVLDIGGELLIISQFTLHAQTKKGNRPSFVEAMQAGSAQILYNYFINKIKEISKLRIESGVFAANMTVEIANYGPVTIIIDSKNKI
jgi:D-aminoacyl-tRNA deacylase